MIDDTSSLEVGAAGMPLWAEVATRRLSATSLLRNFDHDPDAG